MYARPNGPLHESNPDTYGGQDPYRRICICDTVNPFANQISIHTRFKALMQAFQEGTSPCIHDQMDPYCTHTHTQTHTHTHNCFVCKKREKTHARFLCTHTHTHTHTRRQPLRVRGEKHRCPTHQLLRVWEEKNLWALPLHMPILRV